MKKFSNITSFIRSAYQEPEAFILRLVRTDVHRVRAPWPRIYNPIYCGGWLATILSASPAPALLIPITEIASCGLLF